LRQADRRNTRPKAGNTSPLPRADAAERRQLTVMFCDLVGSTALSARFDPEELREEIRGYQNTVSGVVARYDSFVAKFMGDGVLAYFGYPRAHEDDAERAVRAGLEIAAAVASLETRGTERPGPAPARLSCSRARPASASRVRPVPPTPLRRLSDRRCRSLR
jgi:class 3 adenylate cyclase